VIWLIAASPGYDDRIRLGFQRKSGLGLALNVVFVVATDLLQPAVHGTLSATGRSSRPLYPGSSQLACSNEF
jgi:hypothetical protein